MVEGTLDASKDAYRFTTLWTGPSTITTIRTGKSSAMKSMLKATFKEPTGISKHHRLGPVYLGMLGFDGDHQVYHAHGGPEKTVLQYNPEHYSKWREELKDVMIKDEEKRNTLLSVGGFGENLAVEGPLVGPRMDEETMCIGDVVGIRNTNQDNAKTVKIKVTGPREPCFKLSHRHGVADMALRAQKSNRTGWMYSTLEEGFVEVGDEMILLERPYPEWPVARIQHYLYRDFKNYAAIKELLDILGNALVFDVRGVFENRLSKGVEDMNLRLRGRKLPEKFAKYCLREKIQQTKRITEFVFERVEPLEEDSSDFLTATPGSHIRLRFKIPHKDNTELIRPYSVIMGNSNTFRLGIALSDKSRGGSSFLHQNLQIGDVLEGSEKLANTFPLIPPEDADKHIFLAGGIGITAFIDHIQHCIDHNIPFELHYMVRNKTDVAFESHIKQILTTTNSNRNNTNNDDLATNDPRFTGRIYDSCSNDRLNITALMTTVSTEPRTHIYTCGSERLSTAVTTTASTLPNPIPSSRLHFEQFTIDPSGDPFTVELTQSHKKLHVPAEQSLLDALRDAGLKVASSCEAGNCGTCRVRVKCGEVQHRGTGLEEDEKAGDGDGQGQKQKQGGLMLSCVSRGVGRIEVEL